MTTTTIELAESINRTASVGRNVPRYLIGCMLDLTEEQQCTIVDATVGAFKQTCQHAYEAGQEVDTAGNARVHALCYRALRTCFGLDANLAFELLQGQRSSKGSKDQRMMHALSLIPEALASNALEMPQAILELKAEDLGSCTSSGGAHGENGCFVVSASTVHGRMKDIYGVVVSASLLLLYQPCRPVLGEREPWL